MAKGKKVQTEEVIELSEENVDWAAEEVVDYNKMIRDGFAAAALPALITHHHSSREWRTLAAKEAFEVANAMMIESEKNR